MTTAIKKQSIGYLALLVGVALAVGMGFLPWNSPEISAYLGLVVITICAAPAILRYRTRQSDLSDGAAWFVTSYILHFGVGTFFSICFGARFLGIRAGHDQYSVLNDGLLLAAGGALSFWAGYLNLCGKRLSKKLPAAAAELDIKTLVPKALLLAAIGYATRFALIFVQAGSLGAWLAADKDELLRKAEGLNMLGAFTTFLSVALLALIVGWRKYGSRACLAALAVLIPMEIGYRFVSGSRSALGLFVLQAAVLLYAIGPRTPRVSSRFMSIGAAVSAALLVLFPITTSVRFYGISQPFRVFTNSPEFMTPKGLFLFVGSRFHGIESLSLINEKIDTLDKYDGGAHLACLAYAWVPRAIWPDKPNISFGKKFNDELLPKKLYGEGTSVAVTLPGEFRWSLGPIGVLLGMFGIGICIRAVHERYVSSGLGAGGAILSAFLAPAIMLAVEQDLHYILSDTLLNAAFALAGVWFLRRRLPA